MENLSGKLQQRLLIKAQELQKMNIAIKAALPLDCHDHINVAGIRENQLVVLTDSPVWQTRLRMFTQPMLEALEQHTGIELSRIKIKLAPPKRYIAPETPPGRVLSKSSAEIIGRTAECISDPQLKYAMKKLSKRTKK